MNEIQVCFLSYQIKKKGHCKTDSICGLKEVKPLISQYVPRIVEVRVYSFSHLSFGVTCQKVIKSNDLDKNVLITERSSSGRKTKTDQTEKALSARVPCNLTVFILKGIFSYLSF